MYFVSMARLLITTVLLHTLLLSIPAMVTTTLQIYETRLTHTFPITSDTWPVEEVATVEIGGSMEVTFFFDCNTTSGDGSQITWTRRGTPIDLMTSPITNGRRLNADGITYTQLGVYVCQDGAGEELAINITDSNPAVCPVEEEISTIVGGSVELKVYISGIPPPMSNQITWYRPDGSVISSSDANVAFHDGKKKLVLTNVQRSDEGPYRCEAEIPIIPEFNQFARASASVQLSVHVSTQITQNPVDTTVAEFMEVTLTCSATGAPIPSISWEREGGNPLPSGTDISSAVDGETVTSILTITAVRYDDRGMYRCMADNDETEEVASEYALLTVIPRLQLEAVLNGENHAFTDLIFVSENSQLEVKCFGSGTLEWRSSIQGVVISSDPQNQLYQSSDPSLRLQTLHIPNFFANMTAIYTCHSNLVDNSVEEEVLITSSNPAVFISIEEVFILPGDSISLNATVYASPSADVDWYHNNTLIDPAASQHFSFENDRQTLNIRNFAASLAGRYEIVAVIGGGSSARDHVILILPDPPTATITPSMITANENDMVQFRCQGGGSGDIDVEWSLVGRQSLPAGVDITENESGDEKTLTISQVDISHAGTYVCSVRNIAGETETSAVLSVFYALTPEVSYHQSSITTTLLPSASQIVPTVEGSPSTTEVPSCSVDSRTVLFQVRVLDFNCEERNTSLDHIVESFQEQLFRVTESECSCNAQPSHIQVELLRCSERIPGAAVFLGKIETNSTALTQDIFCALLTWQQSGTSLNINGEFYDVDSQCSLQVDSYAVEECAVTDTSTNIDNFDGIIILAVLVGGMITAICFLCVCGIVRSRLHCND